MDTVPATLITSRILLFPMEGQPIVADRTQEETTRLVLTLGAIDGAFTVLFIIFPLIALGEKAWTERFLTFIVPYCGAMVITSVWFAWRLRQIQAGGSGRTDGTG